jgi:hypothetical protein
MGSTRSSQRKSSWSAASWRRGLERLELALELVDADDARDKLDAVRLEQVLAQRCGSLVIRQTDVAGGEGERRGELAAGVENRPTPTHIFTGMSFFRVLPVLVLMLSHTCSSRSSSSVSSRSFCTLEACGQQRDTVACALLKSAGGAGRSGVDGGLGAADFLAMFACGDERSVAAQLEDF